MDMHPRLAPLADDIECQRAALLAAIASQPAIILNATPKDPSSWSPAQIIDHLAIVQTNVARLLAHRLVRAKEAGLARETSTEPIRSRLETTFLTQKIEAPENVRPASDTEATAAIERLLASHSELEALLAAADGYALTDVVARHPIFGDIDMYEWLVFLSRHEQRHVAQLSRTIAKLSER
jgi:hypothetical protein